MASPRIHPAAAPDQTRTPALGLRLDIALATSATINADILPGDLISDATDFRDYAEAILAAARLADRNCFGPAQIDLAINGAQHLLKIARGLTDAAEAITELQGVAP